MRSPFVSRFLALADSDATAVVDDRGAHAHRDLAAHAAGIAHALLRGRASLDGARVLLFVEPSADWVAGFLGIVLAGGIAVPLSPLHPEAEIRYFAEDAAPELALLGASLVERRPWLGDVTVLDPRAIAARADVPDVASRAGDLALMLYTSGTTGRPKGAEISHENLATQAELLRVAWRWSERDRLLHALPLHHMHGVAIALLTALWAGASVHLLPRFDKHRMWDALSGATVMMAVPTMYHRLFEAFDAADDAARERWATAARSLRLATSGSAALPVTLAERWRALTGDIPVERFGMTEIGVGMTNPVDGPRKPGSVGRPLPSVEMRIVDDTGRDVEAGEAGEIWIRGPSVFPGYFGKPEATERAFTGGWFRTGDTATLDADGYVRILGRTSVDILKSGGYKLSALEIEEALRQHPGIAEVAVVGIPDPRWGDRVTAAIVARPGHEGALTTEAVRAFAREHLAPYKLPQQVVLCAELPRNSLGKVIKPELARRLADQG